MPTQTDKELEKLKAEFSALRSDIADLAKTLKKISNDRVGQGRERIKKGADQSREQAREAVNAIESEIGERPWASLAAAFGAGFILGKVLSR